MSLRPRPVIEDPNADREPDKTGVNKRDADTDLTKAPADQGQNRSDVDTTAASIVPVVEAGGAINIPYAFSKQLYSPPRSNSILGMIASYQAAPIIYEYLQKERGQTMAEYAVVLAVIAVVVVAALELLAGGIGSTLGSVTDTLTA